MPLKVGIAIIACTTGVALRFYEGRGAELAPTLLDLWHNGGVKVRSRFIAQGGV